VLFKEGEVVLEAECSDMKDLVMCLKLGCLDRMQQTAFVCEPVRKLGGRNVVVVVANHFPLPPPFSVVLRKYKKKQQKFIL
jgi:hypothetical protein